MYQLRLSRITLLAAAFVLAPSLAAQSTPDKPRGDVTIVDTAARLEHVFDGALSTEGPAAAPDGSIYFSDITLVAGTKYAGHLMRFDPKTGRTAVFRSPSGMSNGLVFDPQGRLVAAEGAQGGGRRITRTDMTSGKAEVLAWQFEGRVLNSPNDIDTDAQGRVYFTDPRYIGREPVEQPVQGVYRIDTDGSVHLIIADAGKPNGIVVAPDQRTLYVAIHDNGTFGVLPPGATAARGRMIIAAYDLAPDGSTKFRRVLVDFAPGLGPDGMAVDRDGNLYVGGGRQPLGIYIYSPEGRELGVIPVPELPRNAEFGRGSEGNVLYITAGKGLYRIKVRKTGFHPGD